jgi:lipoprotein-anchoring transpeptidase ErfK/SrfK
MNTNMASTRITCIEVDKSTCTLTGYTDETKREVLAGPWPCTVGRNPDGADKQAVGDCRTPEGPHLLVSVEDSAEWRSDDGLLAYGPWFLRQQGLTERNSGWTGIGIHGHAEGAENQLGRKGSYGCIRIANTLLLRLKELVVVGETKVMIINSE